MKKVIIYRTYVLILFRKGDTMGGQRIYECIDLKSFYASIECAARGLDPMKTNLVVADPERGNGTICLAVSPSLKALGVRNRCRVFEIPKGIDYIMAEPRMQMYIDCSAEIYGIYLKYIAKEDIHVYSIDEAFMDVTDYLRFYHLSQKEMGMKIMQDIYDTVGIRATCGIGTNLYLAKIALDIMAKHAPDFIGELTEETYCRELWHHKPLEDFWRVGRGTVKRLADVGILDMYDIAHADEKLLYKLFGVNAEYLIDHSWGRESCTMKDIKEYSSSTHSLSQGQVLFHDYKYDEALTVVKEMADALCLDMVKRGVVSNHISLYVGYSDDAIRSAGAAETISVTTNSARVMTKAFTDLYTSIADKFHTIRRINLSADNVIPEEDEQYDLFTSFEDLDRDRRAQKAVIRIKEMYGSNSILKGTDFMEGATTKDRNHQIGGHKSGR